MSKEKIVSVNLYKPMKGCNHRNRALITEDDCRFRDHTTARVCIIQICIVRKGFGGSFVLGIYLFVFSARIGRSLLPIHRHGSVLQEQETNIQGESSFLANFVLNTFGKRSSYPLYKQNTATLSTFHSSLQLNEITIMCPCHGSGWVIFST